MTVRNFKEENQMKNSRAIRIYLNSHSANTKKYVATYTAEMHLATFSVTFPDNLGGALALHHFAEMVRKQFGRLYENGEVEFILPESMKMDSKPVRDVLKKIHAFSA